MGGDQLPGPVDQRGLRWWLQAKNPLANIDVELEGRLFIPPLSFVKVRDILLRKLTYSCSECILFFQISNSVADPDPGSGAFLTPGSGIRDG